MAVIEMTESLQRVGEQSVELSVEERNLLSVAYGSTAGCRRAAWRIITSVEQKENLEADDAKHSPRSYPKTESCRVRWSKFSMFLCLRRRNGWWKRRRPFLRTEPSSGLWSISPLILQFRRMWRIRQSSSRLSLRTGFNCVSEDRSLKTLLFHSLRRSLSYPSFCQP